MTTTPAPPRIAPVLRRVGAFTIDFALALAVAGGVWVATGEPVLAGLALVQVAVALCVWEARSGLTVGNALCRVRTVRVEGPYAPGIRRSALRGLVVAAGFLAAGLGQWAVVSSGAWDRRPLKQGWHDAVANTMMIDVARAPRAAGMPGQQTPAQPLPQPPAPRVLPVAPAPAALPVPAALPAPAALPVLPAPPQPTQRPSLAPMPVIQAVPGRTPHNPPPSPPPSPPAATRAAARAAAQAGPGPHRLSFDNGQSFTVAGAGFIGRRPQAQPETPDAQLLEIVDEDRSVSKTHLQFGIDEQGFWVSDLGSTNGTSVLTPHGEPLDVVIGVRVYVPGDGSVRVGQRQFTARPTR